MGARVEVTKTYAQAYAEASQKDERLILDQVVLVTGRPLTMPASS